MGIIVALEFKKDKEANKWWFGLTLGLVIIPLIIINLFSGFWFHQDHLKLKKYYGSQQVVRGGFVQIPHHGKRTNQHYSPRRDMYSFKERMAILIFHCFGLATIFR